MTYECIEHAAKAVAEYILANTSGAPVYINRPESRTGFINLVRSELAHENRLSIVKENEDRDVVIVGETFGKQDLYVHIAFEGGISKNMYLSISAPTKAAVKE